ncbi:MAG TPA: hypothetical protein GX404_10500 [Syntrophomonadaceae bacterium]|jgi:hypothetical protein|nr:hypothetical protein [Syntrophomonadaceae bacterium]
MVRKRISTLICILALTLLFPASAFALDFNGYVPPAAAPNDLEGIRQDANHFIELFYGESEYFTIAL